MIKTRRRCIPFNIKVVILFLIKTSLKILVSVSIGIIKMYAGESTIFTIVGSETFKSEKMRINPMREQTINTVISKEQAKERHKQTMEQMRADLDSENFIALFPYFKER